ncbi:MAG: methyltransferase [Syntrophales bacterium]|jgi:tRNA1Val (adenine37-N6)-methyltransferase|nr:methyltransferase [Syntrophales bacterium]
MSGNFLQREGEKIDRILAGRLRIIQKERGYRFSIDALLLAHFVNLNAGDDLIELGTGSGIVALILAQHPGLGRVLGIEIQEQLVAIARSNVSLNGLTDRVEIRQADVRFPESLCRPQAFSVAVFNPPYRRMRSGRLNPDAEKAAARHEVFGTVKDFIAAAAYALRPGGRMFAIYPATRMVELIARMRSFRIEPRRLRLVYSRTGVAAVFVLVEGTKGGGESLDVLPPLLIYEAKGEYTAAMNDIFKDLAAFESPGAG